MGLWGLVVMGVWGLVFWAWGRRVANEYEAEELDGYPFRIEEAEAIWSQALADWSRLSPQDRELARQHMRPDVQWAVPGKERPGKPILGYAWDFTGLRLLRMTLMRDPELGTWAYVPLETIQQQLPKFYRDLIEGDTAELTSWDWVDKLPRRAWVDGGPLPSRAAKPDPG